MLEIITKSKFDTCLTNLDKFFIYFLINNLKRKTYLKKCFSKNSFFIFETFIILTKKFMIVFLKRMKKWPYLIKIITIIKFEINYSSFYEL